ncbi:MAG: carbohydrate ABC transporter permease [Armatimonadetes bacterium]|nr:carbohydrate ABC transporter permease [Armatimonadota bacterium]MDE2208014.1 carbohydrate ABC transporter permease [Armatimonadota bacterium]
MIARVVGATTRAIHFAVLLAWFCAVVLPMLWLVSTSLRTTRAIFRNPFGLPEVLVKPSAAALHTIAANYANAWTGSHFGWYFFNSVKVVSISLALILLLGSMTAYALARFSFPLRGTIYYLFLAGLLIPMQLILIPLFFQFTDMGRALTAILAPPVKAIGLGTLTVSLHDTHAGLILIYVAASLPFTVFVLHAFFRTLPGELREAAMMDGAGEYRTFISVMMPLAKPGIVTVAIFNFLGLWNEYLFALVFITSDRLKTLPLGLASIGIQAQYKSDYGLLFAGLVITMVPTLLVYIALQEKLTRGITVGALKG